MHTGLSYSRKKYGRGFQYFDHDNQKVSCSKTLSYIKGLAIPPMWDEVLISSKEKGKILAVGRDKKGRKQYIYSESWQRKQQRQKFSRLLEFAKRLPEMRLTCLRFVTTENHSRDSILALMVSILDNTGIRVGNKKYTDENDTYGLTTLRKKHLTLTQNTLLLDFVGKSHKKRLIDIDSNWLKKHIEHCADRPGYNLFRYQTDDNKWSDIDSEDVNGFIKEHMGADFSCKDFRTWRATCLAVELYGEARQEHYKNPRKKLVNILLRLVSSELGNTPAICRDYYIHPAILNLVKSESLPKFLKTGESGQVLKPELDDFEEFVMRLL